MEDFALVRDGALLFYGAYIRTSDADFAITAQSLTAFEEAARQDERFTCTVGCYWEYKSSTDITVPIDSLDKGGNEGSLRQCCKEGLR